MLLTLLLLSLNSTKGRFGLCPRPQADQTKCLGVLQPSPLQWLALQFLNLPWPGSIVSAKFTLAVCLRASSQSIQRITSQHVYDNSGCWPAIATVWLAYHHLEPRSLSGINHDELASTHSIHGLNTTWFLASLSVCSLTTDPMML